VALSIVWTKRKEKDKNMSKVIRYDHHGINVAVQEHLRGKHTEHCLCYLCGKFKPGTSENCKWANLNYARCMATPIVVSPVFECAEFVNIV